MTFYGTTNETYCEGANGLFCVQSPDLLARGGEFTECESLPPSAEELDADTLLYDLGLCESCADIDFVTRATVHVGTDEQRCQDCEQQHLERIEA
jgi:hypothetical protein